MPKYNISSNEVKILYQELKKETKNFTEIKPEILISNPKQVLIFRLMMGLSQNKFEVLISKQSKNIAKYETGKIRGMQFSTANKIIENIKSYIKYTDLGTVLQNFTKFKEESNGWFKSNTESEIVLKARRKGAIASLRKRRTPQEKILEEELKKANIKFYVNFPLNERIIVDFYLPARNLVIECKEIISNSRRETKEQIQKLAYQGYRIKFEFPEKKLFGLMKTKVNLQHYENEELKGPFDIVFKNIQDLTKNL